MDKAGRYQNVRERADAAIAQLRLIRGRVQKGLHIDPSEFQELAEVISSLRHNCEQHNAERLLPPGSGKPLIDIL